MVESLHDNPLWIRTLEATKDVSTILKAFRNVSSLCEVFQIDTQLNIESTVEDILQRLSSGSIDKLYHEMTSYKTRHSSYGDPVGCMAGTRVDILADLEIWASDDDGRNVYWLAGMAGTGKSSIAHTLCEMLDRKNRLGASFFGSRASDKTNDARLIVPVIAHSLARASPCVKFEIIKALEDDPSLAEPTYSNLDEQFKKLVYDPIRATAGKGARMYKVVVIDAVDECVNLRVVSSLIRLILQFASDIPLKFFIASRDEDLIRSAFYHHPKLSTAFMLHEVEKHLVEDDIRRYIERSLSNIKSQGLDRVLDAWPPPSELFQLVNHSGRLFIYAATAMRYIHDGGKLYKSRLSLVANRDSKTRSKLQSSTIDELYGHILEQACASKEDWEVAIIKQLISIIIFLRNPLTIQAIGSLSKIDAQPYLTSISSVIHVPTEERSPVAPFHASFPDFVTDPTRCSPISCPSFPALVPSKAHEMLVFKCLEHMNHALKHNICGVPEERTWSRIETTNSPENTSKISEALKYSCLYWASHLAEVQLPGTDVLSTLRCFVHEHLLHWMECLSILGELHTVPKSLGSASDALSRFKTTYVECNELQLVIDDARRFLQINFEVVQKHCMEVYQSALVWIPRKSRIREVYATDVHRVPKKLILGLSNSWGPTELVMHNGSKVSTVAVSQNGTRVLSGSEDQTIRIWNTATGEVVAELRGHAGRVNSVEFSPDDSQILSGSDDKMVHIWNAMTGELEAVLKGHTDRVMSVAFSPDGSRIASGSQDNNALVWNATTGEVEVELKGHTNSVWCVAFSPDGSRVASASIDKTVRIWDARTGEVEAELQHSNLATSVAFSPDGARLISAQDGGTSIRIWNARTGAVEMELRDDTWPASISFSKDGSQVMSGSHDRIIRIWNATTGVVEAKLKGHTSWVKSVVFSPDGSQIISGSDDKTIPIWNTTTDEVEAELQGHTNWVTFVAFSQDGSRVASASGSTVLIWNTTTGEVETKLRSALTHLVGCFAFSPDGSRLVSGSDDKMARIWNTTTGELQAGLRGHIKSVTVIAFSQDGSRIASGSDDWTVRIWNAATGQEQVIIVGHTDSVWSVAFSQDGSKVVSGSNDYTVRIWNAATGEAVAKLKGHTDSVTSVAFSGDGSIVISASADEKIRFWKVTARRSQSMAIRDMNHTLPDGSVVYRTGILGFHVIYPGHLPPGTYPALRISEDRRWIVGPLYDCWIPAYYRDFISSAFLGNRFCPCSGAD
ncbi:hypothetical protein M413DRAFT_292432 [Hebeloma cylindrosporum]|uniref:Uncharacterized protein n=1 Tax=Hebeloma cylindrosporum TaxID=76867 RepID=A0A0C3BI31_HEBCY|nr:hypothetical protein M413DRAFT_292432 [Hebeloma cylindrosporum h7]